MMPSSHLNANEGAERAGTDWTSIKRTNLFADVFRQEAIHETP